MKRDKVINRALSIFFTILSLAWIYPVFMIALNSFKKATAISTTTAFDLLTPETFNGLANYLHALNEQGFASAFMYSLIITVTSVVLILVCCSMCAWYVVRVNNKISNFFYYLFVFSMVVPFQMLMFTLSKLADRIGFNTPFCICYIYLGFGAGLLSRRKWSVYYGTLIGGVLRFLAHFLIGVFVWGKWMPATFLGKPMTSPWIYSLIYNGSYMLPSIVLCLVVFALLYKPLRKYFTSADLLAA